ncbi:hypothetical protein MMC07_009188 [Pseudocyphellaria aurata]|nr:hypothetical protein [Pseudocyphellaria aurata]
MYGLSLGVSRVGETLPAPIYALLSGLNAATVGIIIFAAVQLAKKAITDKLTRILVFFGASSGMLYTALWFFPLILLGAGLIAMVWDFRWLHRIVKPLRKRRSADQWTNHENTSIQNDRNAIEMRISSTLVPCPNVHEDVERSVPGSPDAMTENNEAILAGETNIVLSCRRGIIVIIVFMISFVVIMILRGLLTDPPRGYSLFANLYLAGTIIFGGGPVVIPLLREYIVAEGWVSPRDFLFGLALIQSFPGPNFNFAVYLGSLATKGSSLPSAAGMLIAYVGIFAPGLIIQTGIMGVWRSLRSRPWFLCLLRGVNATAVGFIYTAVYKLWTTGFVDESSQTGNSLGRDPWWVIITATSFVGGAWFNLSPPLAILLGAALGLVWYAVVKT